MTKTQRARHFRPSTRCARSGLNATSPFDFARCARYAQGDNASSFDSAQGDNASPFDSAQGDKGGGRRETSVRSSTRMRHESSDALRIEKTIAISTLPKASGSSAISAQTIT